MVDGKTRSRLSSISARFLTYSTILFFSITIFGLQGAGGQEDYEVKSEISILDVDRLRAVAKVNLRVIIQDSRDLNPHDPHLLLSGYGKVICKVVASGVEENKTFQIYWCDALAVEFPLLGSPEKFPFDDYNIEIEIERINFITESFLGVESNAKLDGPLSAGLSGRWRNRNLELPSDVMSDGKTVIVTLENVDRSSNLLIFPILMSFLLIGLGIQIKDRLEIKIALYGILFVFTSTFYFAVLPQIPPSPRLPYFSFLTLGLSLTTVLMAMVSVVASNEERKTKRAGIIGIISADVLLIGIIPAIYGWFPLSLEYWVILIISLGLLTVPGLAFYLRHDEGRKPNYYG